MEQVKKPSSFGRPTQRQRGGTQPQALSLAVVIDHALKVVELFGLSELTTTHVGRRLGVSTPAVYHYVSGNDELVAHVCERVASQVTAPLPSEGHWDDRIVAIVLSIHEVFARYPGVAAKVLPFRRHSSAVERIDNAVMTCIIEGGFDSDTAEAILATMHFLVGGWLLGSRPGISDQTMTPELLEQAVRWTLIGAQSPPKTEFDFRVSATRAF